MFQGATGLESRKGFQARSLFFISTPSECRQDTCRKGSLILIPQLKTFSEVPIFGLRI
jgi:hypothetical protein